MPDIAMCNGSGCLIKNDCYRYTAKPSEYLQSFFVEAPFLKGEIPFKCTRRGYCEHYWPEFDVEETYL